MDYKILAKTTLLKACPAIRLLIVYVTTHNFDSIKLLGSRGQIPVLSRISSLLLCVVVVCLTKTELVTKSCHSFCNVILLSVLNI